MVVHSPFGPLFYPIICADDESQSKKKKISISFSMPKYSLLIQSKFSNFFYVFKSFCPHSSILSMKYGQTDFWVQFFGQATKYSLAFSQCFHFILSQNWQLAWGLPYQSILSSSLHGAHLRPQSISTNNARVCAIVG